MDRVSEHLERSEQYARLLNDEKKLHGDNVNHSIALMQQAQGHALRMVVYHGLAAIAEAIKSR